jgi:hypothetical protein
MRPSIAAFKELPVVAALLSGAAAAGAPPEFCVHDGDTVVFYGDSITNQRLYTVFTEAYVLTRFPSSRCAITAVTRLQHLVHQGDKENRLDLSTGRL